jgi:hypothetical protein
LLLQSQVVFDVPILSNPPVGDPVDVSSDEIDRLTLTLDQPKASREVTAKRQVSDNAITGYDHLLNVTIASSLDLTVDAYVRDS